MADFGPLVHAIQELIGAVDRLRGAFDPGAVVRAAAGAATGDLRRVFTAYVLTTGNASRPGADFIHQPAIEDHVTVVRLIADAALAAVAMWSFYRLMWSHSARSLYTVRIMLPRLMLAVVLINWCLPLFQDAVAVNNALCAAVSAAQVVDLRPLTDSLDDLGSGPGMTLLTTAALLIGYLLLAFAYVVRYALLVVLAVTAPAAGLLCVLPETHHLARQWGSLLVASLFMQPVQLLILSVGFSLNNDGTSPLRHLFALAALYIAFKVPGALHSGSSTGTRAFTWAHRTAAHLAHVPVRS